MRKFIIFITSIAIVISGFAVTANAQNYKNKVTLNCRVDLLVSLDDGSVIIDKNADVPVAPASLTKIMTALVVLKNVPDLNKVMTVSREAIESIAGTGSSVAGLQAGEQLSFYNMLCCLIVPSGNDAAAALAIEVAGSIDDFVKMMNDTAAELGCKKTHFDNPHGLDSENHKTTANDLVLIAKAALKYPAFETIVAHKTYDLPATNMNSERTLVSTNFLLNPAYVSYYNSSCKGIKTGSTEAAGKCLISYASKEGYNYMAVAMGGDYRDSDNDKIEENQAFMDTNRMYDWAFENLKYEVVTKEGQFVTTVPVNYCWSMDSVRLVAKSEVLALVPVGNNSESVSFEPIDPPKSLDAPFSKGDDVCKAKIMYADQQIGTVELAAAENASLSVLLYAKAALQRLTATTVFKIILAFILLLILAYVLLYIRANRIRRKKRELKIVKYNELERNTQRKKK